MSKKSVTLKGNVFSMNDEDLAKYAPPKEPEPEMTEKDKKKIIEQMAKGYTDHSTQTYNTQGGLTFKMTRCCHAQTTWTKGGVVWEVCSRCGRQVREQTYG